MESTSSFSKSSSFRKSNASIIDFLYEIEYMSDDKKVPITQLPLRNPYKAFTKPNSSFPKQVFGPNKHIVLASQLEEHLIPETETEQMIPLHLNEGMVHQWRVHGYTHLHYGAIRLALTLHGKKGLHAVTRVALLDNRYREYQRACIATIQTTLNVGTVFVTLFPNFSVALEDPQVYQNMQIQLLIAGAPQVKNTYAATLHHQMAYRIQNHDMDLSLPRDTEDALLIQLESQQSRSCIYIPRQIPRDELVKLLPESWVTNYEKLHDRSISMQSVDSSIHRREGGAVEFAFKMQEKKSSPTAFCTEINMISPLEDIQNLDTHLPGVPIESFDSLGNPIYSFVDETGHKFFDICDCQKCLMESSDEEETTRQRRKKKSSQQILKERYESGDPHVGLLGEPSGNVFEYYVLYPNNSTPTTPDQEEVPLSYILGPSTHQESPFPPENPTEDVLRSVIANMPQGLREKMLDTVLICRGIETLHGFMRLYIHRYGLDQGPLLGLPFHPEYPFLTTIDMNPIHYGNFPIEAYLVLWYLADLYTIGVLVHKSQLLRYLAKCIMKKRKPHYKILYNWLTLFNNVTWWEEQIREQEGLIILVTFKITTIQNQQENGVTVQKLYETHIHTSYNDDAFSQSNSNQRAIKMTTLNGLEESDIDYKFFCPYTSHLDNRNVFPLGFAEKIRKILAGFHEQYACSHSNRDHPIYRVEGKKYKIKRYIPGQKIYVTEVASDSEEDDSEEDDSG